jgi:hypothetical protein
MSDTITYGQLTGALSSLGFTAQARGRVTVFTEADHDAVIIVPRADSDGVVPVQYLVAARETVFWKGIAPRKDFDQTTGQSVTVKPQARKAFGGTAAQKSRLRRTAKSVAASSRRHRAKVKARVTTVKSTEHET